MAWPLSAYTNRLVEALAGIPNGVIVLGEMSIWSVILMYAAALAPLVSKRLPALLKNLVTPTLILTALGLLAAVLWRGVWSAPDGRLHLVILDMDGSQALLVRGPGGETLLVNGGPSGRQVNNALDRWLSPFDRRLDGLLIDSAQAGSLNGIPGTLESHPVGQAWWGSAPPEGRSGDQLAEQLKSQQIPTQALAAGQALAIGSEVRVEVLASTPEGSALLVEWKNFRALIPAGTPVNSFEPDNLAELSLLVLDARDLEKTTAEEWLAIAPRAVIATPGNSSILPGGLNWLNTRPQGWYQVVTDGKKMWVERSQ